MRRIAIHSSHMHLSDIKMNADIEIDYIEDDMVVQQRMYLTTMHATLIGLRIGAWMRGEKIDA